MIRKGFIYLPSSLLLPEIQSAFGYVVEMVIIAPEAHLTAMRINPKMSVPAGNTGWLYPS